MAPQALNLHTLERQLPKIFLSLLLLLRHPSLLKKREGGSNHLPVTASPTSEFLTGRSLGLTAIENLAILAEPSSFPPLW